MANYNKLWNGCGGSDVERMQRALASLGYDLGEWGVDGGFGDDTEAAVIAFQRDFGLAVDGVAGDETLGCLYRDWAKLGAAVWKSVKAVENIAAFRDLEGMLNG